MAETMTLEQFAKDLNSLVDSNENVAQLILPIDYQDTSEDTIQLENAYQTLLSQNRFGEAKALRDDNPILETRILDATKLNYLQTLMLTAYQYAKEERSAKNLLYDNTESKLGSDNIQGAIDELLVKIIEAMAYSDGLHEQSRNRHVYVEELPENPDPDTFYYIEEE